MAAAEMRSRYNIGENAYSEVFGVAVYESVNGFLKFKMADQGGNRRNEEP